MSIQNRPATLPELAALEQSVHNMNPLNELGLEQVDLIVRALVPMTTDPNSKHGREYGPKHGDPDPLATRDRVIFFAVNECEFQTIKRAVAGFADYGEDNWIGEFTDWCRFWALAGGNLTCRMLSLIGARERSVAEDDEDIDLPEEAAPTTQEIVRLFNGMSDADRRGALSALRRVAGDGNHERDTSDEIPGAPDEFAQRCARQSAEDRAACFDGAREVFVNVGHIDPEDTTYQNGDVFQDNYMLSGRERRYLFDGITKLLAPLGNRKVAEEPLPREAVTA